MNHENGIKDEIESCSENGNQSEIENVSGCRNENSEIDLTETAFSPNDEADSGLSSENQAECSENENIENNSESNQSEQTNNTAEAEPFQSAQDQSDEKAAEAPAADSVCESENSADISDAKTDFVSDTGSRDNTNNQITVSEAACGAVDLCISENEKTQQSDNNNKDESVNVDTEHLFIPEKNSRELVSRIAYLAGIPKFAIFTPARKYNRDVFGKFENNREARILRNLCLLRTAVMKAAAAAGADTAALLKAARTPANILSSEKLRSDGIMLEDTYPDCIEAVIQINMFIENNIDNVFKFIPENSAADFIAGMFIMPDGTTRNGAEKAFEYYKSNIKKYPYKVYLNWPGISEEKGYLLKEDSDFVIKLYALHGISAGTANHRNTEAEKAEKAEHKKSSEKNTEAEAAQAGSMDAEPSKEVSSTAESSEKTAEKEDSKSSKPGSKGSEKAHRPALSEENETDSSERKKPESAPDGKKSGREPAQIKLLPERFDAGTSVSEESKENETENSPEEFELLSVIAYLAGADKNAFLDENAKLSCEKFHELEKDEHAANIRNLCIIRRRILHEFHSINEALKSGPKGLDELSEFIPSESVKALADNGFDILEPNAVLYQQLYKLNGLIEANIDLCKDLFPDEPEWKYLRTLFIMPRGTVPNGSGVTSARRFYRSNIRFTPDNVYLNWGRNGRIRNGFFKNDAAFLNAFRILYSHYEENCEEKDEKQEEQEQQEQIVFLSDGSADESTAKVSSSDNRSETETENQISVSANADDKPNSEKAALNNIRTESDVSAGSADSSVDSSDNPSDDETRGIVSVSNNADNTDSTDDTGKTGNADNIDNTDKDSSSRQSREDSAAESESESENSPIELITLTAYMLGCKMELFLNANNQYDYRQYTELNKVHSATLIRNLCRVRSAIIDRFHSLNDLMKNGNKRLSDCTHLIPASCIDSLFDVGINIAGPLDSLYEHLYRINAFIEENIDDCKKLFPTDIKWKYIRRLFIMPGGTDAAGVSAARSAYKDTVKYSPDQWSYIAWNASYQPPCDFFNNDDTFILYLYRMNGDSFDILEDEYKAFENSTEQSEKSEAKARNSSRSDESEVYNVVSIASYLLGAPRKAVKTADPEKYRRVYSELSENKPARILRNLCILRTAFIRNFEKFAAAMRGDCISDGSESELLPAEAVAELEADGVRLDMDCSTVEESIIELNRMIDASFEECKELFPLWLDYSFVRNIFVMSDGERFAGVRKAVSVYGQNRKAFPGEIYINRNDGVNILENDRIFVNSVYKGNSGRLVEQTRTSNKTAMQTAARLNDFIRSSERVEFVVDCENANPLRFYSALKSIEESLIPKISGITLYDDTNASTIWKSFSKYVNIPVVHETYERISLEKSLVDINLSVGVCRKFYKENVDSFAIVSSDSDYWALINSLVDAKFLMLVEKNNFSDNFKRGLAMAGIDFCIMDNFYSGDNDDMIKQELGIQSQRYLVEHLALNVNAMIDDACAKARIAITPTERRQLFDSYSKSMKLKIAPDGSVSISVSED